MMNRRTAGATQPSWGIAAGAAQTAQPSGSSSSPLSLHSGLAELLGAVETSHYVPVPLSRPAPAPSAPSRPFAHAREEKVGKTEADRIAETAHKLIAWLGPGVFTLMTRAAPPLLNVRDSFPLLPAGLPSPPLSSAPLASSSTTARPAGQRVRTAATTTTLRADPSAAQPARAVGGTLQTNDDCFLRAVLQLPVDRLGHASLIENVFQLISDPKGRHEARITGSFNPDDTPKGLLPSIPRPSFEDYFEARTSSRPPVKWPSSWAQYHSTMSALLLEEARCMLATVVMECGRGLAKHAIRGDRGVSEPASGVAAKVKVDSFLLGVATAFNIQRYSSYESGEDTGSLLSLTVQSSEELRMQDYVSRRPQPRLPINRDVLLIRVKNEGKAPAYCLGMVINGRNKQFRTKEDAHVPERRADLSLRIFAPGCVVASLTAASPPVAYVSLGSIATCLQAYQSVACAAYTPFAGVILRPGWAKAIKNSGWPSESAVRNASLLGDEAALPERPAVMSAELYAALASRFDATQMEAIIRCVSGGAYHVPLIHVSQDVGGIHSDLSDMKAQSWCETTSIVGPPGTGKTRTILGIISALRACCHAPRIPAPRPHATAVLRSTAPVVVRHMPAAVPAPAPVPASVSKPQIHPLLSSPHDVIVISDDDDTEEEAQSVDSSTDSEGDDCFISVGAPKRGLACKRVRQKSTAPPLTGTLKPAPTASAAPAAKRLRREGSSSSSSTPAVKAKQPSVPRTRVLVCAASNAAVDEIVTRLLALVRRLPDGDDGSQSASRLAVGSENVGGGLLDAAGQPFIPNVVRVGAGAAGSSRFGVTERSLDTLVHKHVRRMVREIAAGTRRKPSALSSTPDLSSGAAATSKFNKQQEVDTIRTLETRMSSIHAELKRIDPHRGQSATPERAKSLTASIIESTLAFLGATSPSKPSTAGGTAHGAGLASPGGSASSFPLHTSPPLLRAHSVTSDLKLLQLERELEDLQQEIEFRRNIIAFQVVEADLSAFQQIAMHDVLADADVVATTLAGAVNLFTYRGGGGHSYDSAGGRNSGVNERGEAWRGVTFDAIILDEAGQSIEAEALLPFRLAYAGHSGLATGLHHAASSGNLAGLNACKRLILVGDPLQLPATVLSKSAALAGLDISLFERMCAAGMTPILLRTQYRMHGTISAFSSAYFYKGLVRDADALTHTTSPPPKVALFPEGDVSPLLPSPPLSFPLLSPHLCRSSLLLIDVPAGREAQRSNKHSRHGGSSGKQPHGGVLSVLADADPSFGNDAEAEVVVALTAHLLAEESIGDGMAGERRSIGIITPYKEQVKRIKEKLRNTLQTAARERVVVSTVDSFQGQEVDTVIISCVRSRDAAAAGRGSIGFLSDSRRLNVAITRAKSSLIVVGNVDWLSRCNDTWAALLLYLKEAGNSAIMDAEGRLRRLDGQLLCAALDSSPHTKRLEEGEVL